MGCLDGNQTTNQQLCNQLSLTFPRISQDRDGHMEHNHRWKSRVRFGELSGCQSGISVMKLKKEHIQSLYSQCLQLTMNNYEDCINLLLYCTLFWITHTHKHSYLLISLPLSTQRFLTFVFPPPSLLCIFPIPLYSSPFSLGCCKAFPWLAVINLPSPGAGSWLRASKCSYKAKTAIQKQSRFSCFQSTT